MAKAWQEDLAGHPGKIKGCLGNAVIALSRDDAWQGVLAKNEFTNSTWKMRRTPWERTLDPDTTPPRPWTDQDDRETQIWLETECIFVGTDVVHAAVKTVAERRQFHPVRQYLDALQWDGEPRIRSWLAEYTGVESNVYVSAAGAAWLISAVARIYRPGCKVDCMLILEGAQGAKKSTAFNTLAGEEWFTDNLPSLDSEANAASILAGKWIVEMGELNAIRTTRLVEAVKAFMSRKTDRFRPPYARHAIDQPRQCVFGGSCNDSHYFQDTTGGRRFWPVTVTKVDIDALARDRNQLWAEAVVAFKEGRKWWIDDDAEVASIAAEAVERRRERDPWEDLIRRMEPELEMSFHVSEVLSKLDVPKERHDARGARRVNAVLRELTDSIGNPLFIQRWDRKGKAAKRIWVRATHKEYFVEERTQLELGDRVQ